MPFYFRNCIIIVVEMEQVSINPEYQGCQLIEEGRCVDDVDCENDHTVTMSPGELEEAGIDLQVLQCHVKYRCTVILSNFFGPQTC